MRATSWRVRQRRCALHLLHARLSHFCCGSPRRRSFSLASLDTLPSLQSCRLLPADRLSVFLCSPQAKPFLEAFGPGVIGPARAVEDGGASSNVEGMDAVATTAASLRLDKRRIELATEVRTPRDPNGTPRDPTHQHWLDAQRLPAGCTLAKSQQQQQQQQQHSSSSSSSIAAAAV